MDDLPCELLFEVTKYLTQNEIQLLRISSTYFYSNLQPQKFCPTNITTLSLKNWFINNLKTIPINKKLVKKAIIKGNFYYIELIYKTKGLKYFDETTTATAAKTGNIQLLNWLLDIGCKYNVKTSNSAAKTGNLSLLKWLWYQGCPFDETTFANAVKSGNLEMLEWLKTEKCPFDTDCFNNTALLGNITILEWLWNNKFPWDEWTLINAAKNLNILKWFNNKCEGDMRFTPLMFHYSVQYEDINTLEWLLENGCPWNSYTSLYAVQTKNIEIVKWLFNNGCPFDEYTLYVSAGSGNLDILKWIVENCYMDLTPFIFVEGIYSENIEVLNYLYDLRCPINESVLFAVKKTNNKEIKKWFEEKGLIDNNENSYFAYFYNIINKIMNEYLDY